jgi:hypothetical protein
LFRNDAVPFNRNSANASPRKSAPPLEIHDLEEKPIADLYLPHSKKPRGLRRNEPVWQSTYGCPIPKAQRAVAKLAGGGNHRNLATQHPIRPSGAVEGLWLIKDTVRHSPRRNVSAIRDIPPEMSSSDDAPPAGRFSCWAIFIPRPYRGATLVSVSVSRFWWLTPPANVR